MGDSSSGGEADSDPASGAGDADSTSGAGCDTDAASAVGDADSASEVDGDATEASGAADADSASSIAAIDAGPEASEGDPSTAAGEWDSPCGLGESKGVSAG